MILYPNAKINLGLNIVEKRPDGYHNLETIFYPIPLSDSLEVVPAKAGAALSLYQYGMPIGENIEQNLVVKAFRLMEKHYKIPPVEIHLRKNIPFGAGLGGGSADAAFMLKMLNELNQLNLSDEMLEALATQLGADCPFFIQNKPQFATGIGNEFTPIELSLKGTWLLLVKPNIHISTPMAYSRITPHQPARSLFELLIDPIESWKESMVNDFETSLSELFPEIAAIKSSLYNLGATYASMSGSGSSLFGLFRSEPDEMAIRHQHPDAVIYKVLLP